MMFLVLASAFLVAVRSQAPDPTKSCKPDVHQMHFTSLIHNNTRGVVAFDYPNKIIATRYSNGRKVVFDLKASSRAVINETDGSCVKSALPDDYKVLVSQCLPANARLLGPADNHIGLNPDALAVNAWGYDIKGYGTVRVTVTASSPSVAVVSHRFTADAQTSDIQIFTNANTTIADTTIFKVPDVCPASTVVG